MKRCSRCNRGLTFFNRKRINELEVCGSCYNDIRKEAVKEKIATYLSNKKDLFTGINRVLGLFNKDPGLFKDESLEKPKRLLGVDYYYLTDKASLKRLQSEKGLDDISFSQWKSLEIRNINSANIFLEDLEKLRKLLVNDGLKVDFSILLTNIANYLGDLLDKEANKAAGIFAQGAKKLLSDRINKESALKTLIRIIYDDHNQGAKDLKSGEVNLLLSSALNDHLGIKISESEVSKYVRKELEEIELEAFKESMGSQPQEILGDFSGLDGFQFQDYLKGLFEFLGYLVEALPKSGDQGADLIINKEGERVVVQAKKHKNLISNKAIQEVVAAKEHYKANGALVVTDSDFTESAISLAESNNVDLWNGKKLRETILRVKSNSKPYKAFNLDKIIEIGISVDSEVNSAREKVAETLFRMASMVGLKPGNSAETILKKLVETFNSQSKSIEKDSLPAIKIMLEKHFSIRISLEKIEGLIKEYSR